MFLLEFYALSYIFKLVAKFTQSTLVFMLCVLREEKVVIQCVFLAILRLEKHADLNIANLLLTVLQVSCMAGLHALISESW